MVTERGVFQVAAAYKEWPTLRFVNCHGLTDHHTREEALDYFGQVLAWCQTEVRRVFLG
jgi:hypothetical protein